MKKHIILITVIALLMLASLPVYASEIPLSKSSQKVTGNPAKASTSVKYFRADAPRVYQLEQQSQQKSIIQPEPQQYPFANPAGCSATPPNLSPEEMLLNVQKQLGDSLILDEKRITYIWNEELGSMIETVNDSFVYEFGVNDFQPPFTYKGDEALTIFLQNGFVVWFRSYGGIFRLMAVPMVSGVEDTELIETFA